MTSRDDAGAPTGLEIAVVGMAGRFPGAAGVDELWANVAAGVESIRRFSDDELDAAGVPAELRAQPGYVPAGGVLDGIEEMDARFFGYGPREAEILDPQHRLFLEWSWQALEDAGIDPRRFARPVGVWGGTDVNTYLLFHLLGNPELARLVGAQQLRHANRPDTLTTRVAYALDLTGPAVTVQTTCSTGLVAVHLACQSLLNGECDLALAGGVSVDVGQRGGYLAREGGVLSPDGHVRAFDAEAAGMVSGNGGGVVALARLEDALDEGHRVLAVIKGSAINNDGARKVSYSAPGLEGQARVVRAAQVVAGVEPDTIGYVEAHGTGTRLGDPIEVAALTRAFRAGTDRRGFCALGSVKTNIGHLDAGAGVAGLIKAVQALRHRRIPPSLHFRRQNPEIDLAASPFYVAAEVAEWPADGGPRRAGVSSLGIGGTNAHVVLEEAPAPPPPAPSRPRQLLVVSARSAAALGAALTRLGDHLRGPGAEP
ncbi:MAG TPA: polyketide synthase, partial [Thermoanaerobaculia bacterium]|nr:polyketide synthase [Thermoanaerobaculia bacterium]